MRVHMWGWMDRKHDFVEIDDSQWESDLSEDEIYSRLEIEHAQWILEHARGGFKRMDTNGESKAEIIRDDGRVSESAEIESAVQEIMAACRKYGVDICLRTNRPNDADIVLSGPDGWMRLDDAKERAEEESQWTP